MALLTVQRSPSVPGSPQCPNSESEMEEDEAYKNRKNDCFFAGKGDHVALTLEGVVKDTERRLSAESLHSTNSTQSNNSDIQHHLQSMFYLLRHKETLKMAVKLESQRPNRTRYLVIASRCCRRTDSTDKRNKIMRRNSNRTTSLPITATWTLSSNESAPTGQVSVENIRHSSYESHHERTSMDQHCIRNESYDKVCGSGDGRKSTMTETSNNLSISVVNSSTENVRDDVEESCLLGIDCNERTTIGLVVPILADTTIHLDGDGGFSVSVYGKTHIFKPVSVQAMWSALQTLHKVSQKARENNYYPGGPSHDWLTYYDKCIESEQSCLNEWNAMDSLESRRPPSPDAIRNKPTAKEETEGIIKMKLKEIMMSVDLDEVTSKYIRSRLEELLDMDLGEFKSFIDEEMLTILGQMDAPTEIFEHVYLGSEWNASNLEELQKNGVRHILNVTREIDNFFPGTFDYLNVRVYDDEKTNLLKHWDNTYRYITRAKAEGSKVLVHCKMGVSRSASVVIAYAMKAYNWDFQKALQHVKERRSCIKPNKNFLNQLETYRGMLDAMKNKEKLQRSKSETNLKSTKDARLLPGSEPTPLIQALNYSKTKLENENRTVDPKLLNSLTLGMTDLQPVIGRTALHKMPGISAYKQEIRRRRSNSTSPQIIKSKNTPILIIKQQSQSLENLTPERNIMNEPKNMRFPGSNGENYSVTQNQVLHIQKNTHIQWSSPLLTESKTESQPDSASSVRNIILDLEAHQFPESKKTGASDTRQYLNTTKKRMQIAGEPPPKSTEYKMLGNTIWTSSAKLITQISNITATDLLRSMEDSTRKHQHSRKTLSWTATGGGIVMDNPKQTAKNNSAPIQTVHPGVSYCENTERTRQRMPSRHSSWGSGDNKCGVPVRHSSWEEYDCNCNNYQYMTSAKSPTNVKDAKGQLHALNKTNKTALAHCRPYLNPSQHTQNNLGTVKRTKQKLERDATLKKLCQDNSVSLSATIVNSEELINSSDDRFVTKGNSNLIRSASAITSTHARVAQRCNSEETVHDTNNPTSIQLEERKDDTFNTIYSTSAPNSYEISDVENKNTLLSCRSRNDCEEDGDVTFRTGHSTVKTISDDRRKSGNVQILKKSFEKKANCGLNSNILGVSTVTTTNIIKSHQSLPASPVAQHINYSDQNVNEETTESYANQVKNPCFIDLTLTPNITPVPTNNPSLGTEKGHESQKDYNVKVLVHKYQTSSPVKTQHRTTSTKGYSTSVKSRPRSCYEPKRSIVGNYHEFTNSRPPPGPTKSTSIIPESVLVQQEPLQQRRLQQHGRTHPLSRLSLPKHTFNAAAYNTM